MMGPVLFSLWGMATARAGAGFNTLYFIVYFIAIQRRRLRRSANGVREIAV
jgi:hypothetical protein